MPGPQLRRANQRSRSMHPRIGGDLRTARLEASLSLRTVAATLGISVSEASRIELGDAPWLRLTTLCRYAAVVGLDLWARTYPGGEALRDSSHVKLGGAFRKLVGPGLTVRAEVTLGDPRDLRAWDLTLADRAGSSCGVELETRFVDAQDQLRRITRKAADGGLDRLLVVVADTRANRIAVSAAAGLIGSVLAIDDPAAVEALADGRIPPRDALIFVRTSAEPPRQFPPRGKVGRTSQD